MDSLEKVELICNECNSSMFNLVDRIESNRDDLMCDECYKKNE